MDRSTLESPAWRAAAATVASYLVLLAVLFAVVFVVPYLLASML